MNLLGVHNTVAAWIRTQSDPKNPAGTVINVNSALAGVTMPGNSAYSISKLAAHKYMEFVGAGEQDSQCFDFLEVHC